MHQSRLLKIPALLLHQGLQRIRRMRSALEAALAFLTSQFQTGEAACGLQSMASDQRQHPRVALQNTTVYVTDGCLFATAMLENISQTGICLCNLPEQLYKNAGQLTVFSSDNPGLPVLQIEPRWQKIGWRGKTIGGTILNATDAWRLFFVHTAGQFSM